MPYTLKPPFWSPSQKTLGTRQAPIVPLNTQPEPDTPREPSTRRIEVQTTPSRARIYVDGKYRAKSPCFLNIPSDREVSIVVDADGFGKAIDRIRPEDPDFYQITLVELAPDPDPDRVL